VALILLTNDDGIEAEGLQFLRSSLLDVAEVQVVAPDRERSAVSHGLTIHTPLVREEYDRGQLTLNGTPADCVIYAISNASGRIPDLVISGINRGANLGDDIMYSGTVAGAREASRRGVPALAVSQAYDSNPVKFKKGAQFVRALVKTLLGRKPVPHVFLNINIPPRRIRGWKVTRQGCASFFPHFNALEQAEGQKLVIGENEPAKGSDIPFDFQAVMEGYISITPLQRDQTDYGMIETLLQEGPRLFPSRRIPGLGLID